MPRLLTALEYCLEAPRTKLVFTPQVLATFDRHRQRQQRDREAGGQLFAQFAEEAIVIEVATGPHPRDQRTRTLFVPDRRHEQRDIDAFFSKKLHFIGNWHTHPQHVPTPSTVDISNTRTRFRQSDHILQAFVMVIAGLNEFPGGLFVALINDKHLVKLQLSSNFNADREAGNSRSGMETLAPSEPRHSDSQDLR